MTWKESKLARGTYQLKRAEVRFDQDIERQHTGKGHLHPGEGKGQDG